MNIYICTVKADFISCLPHKQHWESSISAHLKAIEIKHKSAIALKIVQSPFCKNIAITISVSIFIEEAVLNKQSDTNEV